MTEVAPDDRSGLLRSKRAECSSIVTSRKRKLRELYAIATVSDAVPNRSFKTADAPPATPGESQFLLESDILQGRKLDGFQLPTRQQRDSDLILRFKRFLAESSTVAAESATDLASTSTRDTGLALASSLPHAAHELPVSSRGSKAGSRTSKSLETNSLASRLISSPRDKAHAETQASTAKPKSQDGSQQSLQPPLLRADAPNLDSSNAATGTKLESAVAKAGAPHSPLGSSARGTVAKTPELETENDGRDSGALQPRLATGSQDATDTGDDAKANREASDQLSIQLPSSDLSKAADILSSPGSTTHTATTPAVHDASTDTSPDNDGLQYGEPDREEEKMEGEAAAPSHAGQEPASEDGAVQPSSAPTLDDSHALAKNGVEAQLLEESAAARATEASQPLIGSDVFPRQTGGSPHQVASKLDPIHQDSSVTEQNSGSGPLPEPSDQASSGIREIPDSQGSSPPEPLAVDERRSQTVPDTTQVQPPVGVSPKVAQGPQESVSSKTTCQVDKAITRMSSGAIKQKSVTEILGGGRKSTAADPVTTPLDVRRQRPMGATPRPDKGKGKKQNAPAVVFGQQQKRAQDKTVITLNNSQSDNPIAQDYLAPLFLQNFALSSKKMKSIDQLLNQAHKTVSSADMQNAMLENQACRVLRRVYSLQNQEKWALRQPSRCPEPQRPRSHQDVLLKEMKWMRTDFREERKWKQALCRKLAVACSLWVASSPEQKKALQVSCVIPRKLSSDEDIAMVGGIEEGASHDATEPNPALAGNSHSPADPDQDDQDDFRNTVAPSAIFALQEDDVVFSLARSPTSDQLLAQLPEYGSPLNVPGLDTAGSEPDPDSSWRRPAVPVSKFVEGEVVLAFQGPPSKRSRYQYLEEQDDDDGEEMVFGATPNNRAVLERGNKDVALFNPEMKAVRDRLHAGHQFRPPTEHPMPLQSFYECRGGSQWTWAEDDQLKALVREYSYNWSLISSMVSSKSLLTPATERRTPWECFERWVQLEGLPSDMSKTQYFRTYQNRIDAAQRAIHEHNQKLPQANPSGIMPTVQRKRPTTTMRVERRRNQKHLALIDTMRKQAKKREAAIQKQQYAATMRKVPDPPQQRGPVKTPKEYSAIRYERDQQMAEKLAHYAQRQNDAQRRFMSSRSQGQTSATPGASVPVPPQVAVQMAANPLAAAQRANVPNQLAVPGQPRPRMPMQTPPGAMAGLPAHMGGNLVPPIPLNGIPQNQLQAMQAQHQMQMPNSQPNLNLMLQARRIQDQQRQAVQAQQQQAQQHAQQQGHQPQQLGGPQGGPGVQNIQGSPPGMRAVNGMNQQSFMANAQAALAAFNGPGGAGIAAVGGVLNLPNMPLGSPQSNSAQPAQMGQVNPTVMAHILELEAGLKAKNPNLSPDQARRLAITNYQAMFNRQRQNAMTAASGGSPQQALVNGMTGSSPHQYAQLLRAQQHAQQQHAAQAAAAQHTPQHQRQPSSGGTPMSK